MGKTRQDRLRRAFARSRPAAEARELTAEVGRAFVGMVGYYHDHGGLWGDQARAKAAECLILPSSTPFPVRRTSVSWSDLDTLAHRDPAQALARWEEIKQAARGEVASGYQAARAMEGFTSHCWSRARVLAVRAELTVSWRPRSAAEQHLIGQLVQFQTLMWDWLEKATAFDGVASSRASRSGGPNGSGGPPLPSDAERLERAAGLAERAAECR